MNKYLILITMLSLTLWMFAPAAYADVTPLNKYDANGNQVSGDGKFYEYNDANQLIRVRQNDINGAVISEYFYDYTGQRVKNVENGVTTYYIGQHFEANVVAGKADNTSYYLAGNERVAKKDSTGTYFYHPDHLGGINAVTDINGAVVSKTSYLPFGEIRQGGQDKYSYTGKEMDKATNLYYFNARYNNPQSRHFTQADTADADLSDPQDLNRYAYVGNNPLSYVDPDGHKKNHHSKAEQKKLAKQRAAANAQKKAAKEEKAKQRAAAEYAKHHPSSGGQISVGSSSSSASVAGENNLDLVVTAKTNNGRVLGVATRNDDTTCTEKDSPLNKSLQAGANYDFTGDALGAMFAEIAALYGTGVSAATIVDFAVSFNISKYFFGNFMPATNDLINSYNAYERSH